MHRDEHLGLVSLHQQDTEQAEKQGVPVKNKMLQSKGSSGKRFLITSGEKSSWESLVSGSAACSALQLPEAWLSLLSSEQTAAVVSESTEGTGWQSMHFAFIFY